jgi:hypothetical protein
LKGQRRTNPSGSRGRHDGFAKREGEQAGPAAELLRWAEGKLTKGGGQVANLRKMFTVLLILAYIPIVIVLFSLWSTGYLRAVIAGPKIVQSASSPDGRYVAYVRDDPCIDPPSQSLVVEREDKTRFLPIARLAADVDSIKEIYWSPDSQIVVFSSRCYLTATRISDWQTIRIYLGKEWMRSRPSRVSTFCGAQPIRTVTAVEFRLPDIVAYRIDDQERWNTIEMNSDRREAAALSRHPNQALHASVASAPQPER